MPADVSGPPAAAIVFDRYGPAEVLRVAELGLPAPATSELRVRVRAAGVNAVDVKVRRGDFADVMTLTFPQRLGNEFAGIVDALGPEVDGVDVGQEVLGFATMAAHATHLVVPADHVTPKPPGIPWSVAGGLSAAGQTARHAVTSLHIGPGDTVLVHAAAGGVGTLAVQLAVQRGATVLGTASPRNHDYLRTLGAIPIAYGDGLADRVRDQAPNGVDAMLDLAGDRSIDTTLAVAADRARIATTVDDRAAERYGIQRLRGDRSRHTLAELATRAAAGDLRLPIHLAVPLEDAWRAHHEVEAGHVRGKVVLRADDTDDGPRPSGA